MNLVIRPYAEADRLAIVDLFDELNRHEFEISGDRKTDRAAAELGATEMTDALAGNDGTVALVAEMDGDVAGIMVWGVHEDYSYVLDELRRHGRVEDIVVAARFRGLGVGQALLAEAERLTREAGIKRLRLTMLAGNDVALTAYRRAGFRDYSVTLLKNLD
jgi:GNAT superfamily N-acetyltransferase